MAQFDARVERVADSGSQGDVYRVALSGEVNMQVAPELRRTLHEVLEKNPREIVVDLAGVPFIDSSGVATLVEALRLQLEREAKLRIENARESVRYTFEITRLTRPFGMADATEESSKKAQEKP